METRGRHLPPSAGVSAGLVLLIAALLILGLPGTARGNHVAGATYYGNVGGGGTVTFRVSDDGTKVLNFTARDVEGNTCIFTKVVYTTPMTISNHSFSNDEVKGSFPGPGKASGSINIFQAGIPGISPDCGTGTHSWSASTIHPQTLVVKKKGYGSGKVTSKPSGISCGGDCKENYDKGTKVTLKANPGANSRFGGWGGACSGKSDCKVTMNSDKTVTAKFIAVRKLTVTKEGTGTGTVTSQPAGINCGSDCTQKYKKGTAVTLTATPSDNSDFAGWSGACSGTGSCNVTMDGDRNVGAEFMLTPSPTPSPTTTPTTTPSPSPSVSPTASPTASPSPSPSPTSTPGPGYQGTWTGLTEQGDPVGFTVNSSNLVTHYTLGYDTGTCTGTAERTFATGGLAIDEIGSFSDAFTPATGANWWLDGFFYSNTEASGTMLVSGDSGCGAVAYFWDATKQSGSTQTVMFGRLLK